MVVAVASAAAFTLTETPVYSGRARVLLQQSTSVFTQTGGSGTNQLSVPTEIQVFSSAPVRQTVQKKVGTAPAPTVTQVGDTNVVEVTAQSTSPAQAAALANAYGNAYIDYKRQSAIDGLLSASKAVQPRIDDLNNQIATINSQIAAQSAKAPADSSLTTERDDLVRQKDLLSQTVGNLQVDASLAGGGPQLVAPAAVPSSPSQPRPLYNGLLGFAVGLIVGVALAFLFEHLDDSIKGTEDISEVSPQLSVVGVIPSVPDWKRRGQALTVAQTAPTSPAAEAYRTLRTSLLFLGLDSPLKVVQVTSASGSEGKTTTVANLAVTFALTGQSVIVMSCDLRRPRVHEFLNVPNDIGFTSVFLGEVPLTDAIVQVPGQKNLHVLGSGPIAHNPAELLNSTRTSDIIDALKARFDLVLIDSPPILPVTDAAVISGRVDGTLMVVTAGVTTKRSLTRALNSLRQVDAPIIGFALNRASSDGGYGYSYEYYPPRDAPRAHPENAEAKVSS